MPHPNYGNRPWSIVQFIDDPVRSENYLTSQIIAYFLNDPPHPGEARQSFHPPDNCISESLSGNRVICGDVVDELAQIL